MSERRRFSKEPIEQHEVKLTPAVLMVYEPDGISFNYGISFDAIDEIQCQAYRSAILEICLDEKLQPFHQSGFLEKTGEQIFEFWAFTNKEAVAALFPRIHAKAKENFDRIKGSREFK